MINYAVTLKEDKHLPPITMNITVPELKDVTPFAKHQMKVWGWPNGTLVMIDRKEDAPSA